MDGVADSECAEIVQLNIRVTKQTRILIKLVCALLQTSMNDLLIRVFFSYVEDLMASRPEIRPAFAPVYGDCFRVEPALKKR